MNFPLIVSGFSKSRGELAFFSISFGCGGTSSNDKRLIQLYYGARSKEELYCLDTLRRWEEQLSTFSFIPVLSEEPDGSDWKGKRGLVTDVLARETSDFWGVEVYVCGPPLLIDAAMKVFAAAGVPSEDIRVDRFVQAK